MELEQLSDNIRLQNADTYSLRKAFSRSDLVKAKELEKAIATLENFKSMYAELEQYMEAYEDITACMQEVAQEAFNEGYGNNDSSNFMGLLNVLKDGIDDYQSIVEELKG